MNSKKVYKMQKNEKSKNILLTILLLSLVTLSIAYATLTQYLYINSQATVAGATSSWDVKFTAASCHATGNAAIIHDFDMDATVLTGLISKFNAPGDSIVCNIKVTNNSVVNAKLATFTIQDGNLTYTGMGANKAADEALVTGKLQHHIVYGAGDAREGLVPTVDDTLPSGVTRDLVLTITYPSTATLPDNNVTVEGLKTTFLYVQN